MKIYFFKGSFDVEDPIVFGAGLSIGSNVRWRRGGTVYGAIFAIGFLFWGMRIGVGRFES